MSSFNPEWKYAETVKRRIRVMKINARERHLDAQNIDEHYDVCLDAAEGLDLGKIKKAKIYVATIRISTAELSGEFERQLNELAMTDERLRHSLHVMKRTGSDLKKFELLAVK